MSIVLFREITTEDKLKELEAKALEYTGLYVDMKNPPERKYVKEMADDIISIQKKLDRARIDISKKLKSDIDNEARVINERLANANEPFTILLDEYKKERAAELAEEKRIQQMRELAIQKELDHESALIENELFDLRKAEYERNREAIEAEQKKQAIELAKQQLEQEQAAAEAIRLADENKRLADVNHRAKINNAIMNDFLNAGIDQDLAKAVTIILAKNLIKNVKVIY